MRKHSYEPTFETLEQMARAILGRGGPITQMERAIVRKAGKAAVNGRKGKTTRRWREFMLTRRDCEGCGATEGIQLHHIVPRAATAKGTPGRHGCKNMMPLCGECHDTVHRVFGAGHRYHGPTTKEDLAAWFRIERAQTAVGMEHPA